MSSAEMATQLPNQPQRTSTSVRRMLFMISLAAALPVVVTLGILNEPLQNTSAPQGVVSFELARTVDQQNKILGSWSQPLQLRLAFSIGLDFFCAVVFTSTLALTCIWLADASRHRGALASKLGWVLAWALGIIGVFWMLQNTLLAAALFGRATAVTAQITYWCALLKFAVIGIGFAYIVFASVALVVRGQFRRTATPH